MYQARNSTVDNMFGLQNSVHKYTNKPGGRLYVLHVYIDFQKAVDVPFHHNTCLLKWR